MFLSFYRFIEHFFQIAIAFYLFALMMITAADVLARYVFNTPLYGSTELTEYGLGLLIFTTLPLLAAKNEHITVDLLESFLSKRFKRIRNIFLQGLLLLCWLALGSGFWLLGKRALRDELISELLEIPVVVIMYYTAFMLGITVLFTLVFLIKQFTTSLYLENPSEELSI